MAAQWRSVLWAHSGGKETRPYGQGVKQRPAELMGWTISSTVWLLNLPTPDSLGQITLCCRVCPKHRGMFNSISGLFPLDSSSALPAVTTQNVSRCFRMTSGGPMVPA